MTPTGEGLADYFGQVSQNDADFKRIIGAFLIAFIWILVVVYLNKGDKIKEWFNKTSSGNTNLQSINKHNRSSGYVYDVNNNQILTMDMNPINEGADIFVPKYKSNEESKNNSNKIPSKLDLITEVNSIVNLLVKNNRLAIFDYVKKIAERGILFETLAENVVFELDTALRTKVSGETNKANIVLSQIVSHWSNEKIESVIGGFLGIMENGYSDKVVGVKVAMLKMMKN